MGIEDSFHVFLKISGSNSIAISHLYLRKLY